MHDVDCNELQVQINTKLKNKVVEQKQITTTITNIVGGNKRISKKNIMLGSVKKGKYSI